MQPVDLLTIQPKVLSRISLEISFSDAPIFASPVYAPTVLGIINDCSIRVFYQAIPT